MIAVALAYAGGSRLVELKKERPLSANIAAYALGPDYHQVIKGKLAQLGQACANIVGRPVLGRSCVDTAPLWSAKPHGARGSASSASRR